MAKVDLAGYTLGELKGLQHEVARTLTERQQQQVQNAREQILAIAKEAGVSVEELLGNAPKKTRKGAGDKVQPKYQDPKDVAQT